MKVYNLALKIVMLSIFFLLKCFYYFYYKLELFNFLISFCHLYFGIWTNVYILLEKKKIDLIWSKCIHYFHIRINQFPIEKYKRNLSSIKTKNTIKLNFYRKIDLIRYLNSLVYFRDSI